MACRTGCPTPGAHSSYGECARSAGVRVAATMNSPKQSGYDQTKRELREYRALRANGVQPEGTTADKIAQAKVATRRLGRPYNAATDPPARLIATDKAAKYVNKTGGEAA